MTKQTILITGATGRTGRRLVTRLRDREQFPKQITVRSASRQQGPPFSWDDPASWEVHLVGADAVFVCYAPDVADPEAPPILGAFAARARAHGVARLVLQSGRGDQAASPSEESVKEGFPGAIVVRSAWFQQNFAEHFLQPQVVRGRLQVPVADVREPFVDLDDSVEALTRLLTEPETYLAATRRHSGLLEFTGPEALTFGAVAGLLSSVLDRTVIHQPTDADDFVANAGAYGLEPAEAEGIAWLFAEVMNGSVSNVTNDLEALLGRPAGRTADYISRTAPSGVWDQADACAS